LFATLKAFLNKASSRRTCLVVAFVERDTFRARQAAADEGSQGPEVGVDAGWSKAVVLGTARRIGQRPRKIDVSKARLKEGFWHYGRTSLIRIENRRAFDVIISDRRTRNHRLYRFNKISREVTNT